jgi:hypothetical protein
MSEQFDRSEQCGHQFPGRGGGIPLLDWNFQGDPEGLGGTPKSPSCLLSLHANTLTCLHACFGGVHSGVSFEFAYLGELETDLKHYGAGGAYS